MRQLLRYFWDDAYSYLALAGTSIGVLVGFLPMLVPNMPSSYGWWIAGICGVGFLYRAMKAAILLRFGRHTEARIAEQSSSFRGVSNLTYFFRLENASDAQTLHFTIHGKWDICNCPRHRELLVAYWKSYPNFHIAYWNYNTPTRDKQEHDSLELPSEKTKFPQDFS